MNVSGTLNLSSILLFNESGVIFENKFAEFVANLTSPLERKLGSNLSSIFPWFDKSNSVLTTLLAFLENHNVSTITTPAQTNRKFGVGTLVAKTPIPNSFAATPDATHAS